MALKYVVLAEIFLLHSLGLTEDSFIGVNIYLTVVFMNVIPCWFIIKYLYTKYGQDLRYLGIEFKHVPKKIMIGFVGYVTCMPFLLLTLLISFMAMTFFKAEPPPHPLVPIVMKDESVLDLIYMMVFACILGPITEEIFFRGLLYPLFKKRVGIVLVAVLTAMLFAFLHMNWVMVLSIFVLGILFAYLYEKTGSLLPSMFVHMLHNTIMFIFVFVVKRYI